jgi:purine-binding chemotaxis protein CheW
MSASAAITGNGQPIRKILLFQVAGEDCAIPLESVAEIVPMAALARSPGLPSVVEGFLNLRGAAVPVIRLDRLFGRPPQAPGLYAHLVVLRGPQAAALLADRVIDIPAPPPEAFRPLEEDSSFNGCAAAEVDVDGRFVHLLSPGRLLLEQERQAIAEFQALSQRYIEELERRPE